jgi:GH15 family glucan-1,4-alpha-glucosidase
VPGRNFLDKIILAAENWMPMRFIHCLFAAVGVGLLAWFPAAAATPLVTGNGFGFAVVEPENGTLSKFYAHPYCFTRPDPQNPLSEGIETANFIKHLSWNDVASQNASLDYMEESQIIHAQGKAGDGFFFMPFGLQQAALVITWEPVSGEAREGYWSAEWNRPVRSRKIVRMFGTEMQLLTFEGIQESLLLIPLGKGQQELAQPQQYLSGKSAWVLLSLENEDELKRAAQEFHRWQAGLEPKELVKREIAEIERWRVKPAVQFLGEKERRLWRQSEIVLRMAQSREPNRPGRFSNGLIVASLPDGLWFTPWVRDMAYAAVAFARMGHQGEARAALLAYFNARPTGTMRKETGGEYQVSVVRYFGDGSEEPFFTMEGSTNIEFDDWGLVLWSVGEYLERYKDPELLRLPTYRGRLYESARDYVAKPLLANLEKYGDGLIVAADTSIWEERQKDKKHFAFSTAAAIVGLRNFAEIAGSTGEEHTRTEILAQVALLEKGFEAAFLRGGKLRGTLEEGVKNDIDGALLAIINFEIVSDPAILRDTVDRMELLKVASGGYRRVRGILTDPSIFEYWYEKQEFLFVDFSLAEVYRRLGRNADADAILKRITDKAAADHYFIPEMYVAESCTLFPGELGDPTGAKPMVGYGAGVYILEVLRQARFASRP